MPLFRESGIVEDPWQRLADDAPVPADGMILVGFTRWREARAALLARELGEVVGDALGHRNRPRVG